jgi:hypothetical protein
MVSMGTKTDAIYLETIIITFKTPSAYIITILVIIDGRCPELGFILLNHRHKPMLKKKLTITILDTIHCPLLYLEHDDSEAGSCIRLGPNR